MNYNKQRGMTLIGMLFVAAVVVGLGLLAYRVIPVYVQNFEVKRSITALQNLDKGVLTGDDIYRDVATLRKRLNNQFNLNRLSDLKTDKVEIEPVKRGVYKISVHYKVVQPLFGNVNLLFIFKESQEVHVDSQ